MHNTYKSTLILGASTNAERYSNKAFYKLKAASHTVFALGFRDGVLGDTTIHTEHQSEWNNVDTVTLYLSPARQETYYDYLLNLKPRRVIFNPGTENQKLESLLQEAGIETEQACTLVLLATNQY
ncbi:MAG: CoA-binding protein [Flavobacteriales bacterium]|jgi:predicted CoA-binding protein|nr:CoA-binding protein [Candidatus Arcticimaribacter sp.]|tara:strand:- start:152 stop:526 length:375 start_codon:yes stop_codon:yes gene_type:complete